MSTEQHDNDFTFDIDGLTSVEFQVQDHSITDGQPYGGVTCSGNTVTVKAGRHKSDKVKNWFNGAVAGSGGIALTYADTTPDQLNFGVSGTLTLNIGGIVYTSENFVLAQGSASSGDNNWWLGSPQMSGITHTNVDEKYAEQVTRLALSYFIGILTEDPEGPIKQTSKFVAHAVKKHKVGSGEVAFTMSNASSSVTVVLFQMKENHVTQGSLVGVYSNPNQ